MLAIEEIANHTEINALVGELKFFGYSEYSTRHMNFVSKRAGEILEKLGYSKERIELAKISGYLHDIGICINKAAHANIGGILVFNILKDFGVNISDTIKIITAIGNHEEKSERLLNEITAALIIADKSDVNKSRVINGKPDDSNEFYKLNYCVLNNDIVVDVEKRKIKLGLDINTKIYPIIEFFEIFMERAIIIKNAAKYLNVQFELFINDFKVM